MGVGRWYRVKVGGWYRVGIVLSVDLQPCMDALISYFDKMESCRVYGTAVRRVTKHEISVTIYVASRATQWKT